MRKRSIMWAGLAVIAVIVVGTAAAASGRFGSSSKAGVMRMALGAEPPSLDAGLATDTTSSSILLNLMDPLIRLGPGPALKPLPGAAKGPEARLARTVVPVSRSRTKTSWKGAVWKSCAARRAR